MGHQTFEPIVIGKDDGSLYKWDTILGRYVHWSEIGALKATVERLVKKVDAPESSNECVPKLQEQLADQQKEEVKAPNTFVYDGNKWVNPLEALTKRVEALERSNIEGVNNFVRRINGSWAIEQSLQYALTKPLQNRISKLEEGHRHNTHIMASSATDKLPSISRAIDDITDRLSKLEEKSKEPHEKLQNDGRPLIEPDTIGKQVDRIMRQKSVSHTDDYMISIDPDASPKDIPFEVALMYAKAGRRVKMVSDSNQDVFVVRNGRFIGSHRHSVVSCSEVMATDWMVLPKDQGE